MKDLPHHIKKLNRKVIRSARRIDEEELPEVPTWPDSKAEERKKEKREMRAAKEAKVPTKKTPEERNKEMKRGRVPVFDRNSAEPKHTRASKKKTPKI